jgi:hypothetical protein
MDHGPLGDLNGRIFCLAAAAGPADSRVTGAARLGHRTPVCANAASEPIRRPGGGRICPAQGLYHGIRTTIVITT